MSANPGQGIENEYSQEILFRPLREIGCSVDGGESKKTDRTVHISVPVTSSSNLFSTVAVSVTGFCCTTMLSFDMTEINAPDDDDIQATFSNPEIGLVTMATGRFRGVTKVSIRTKNTEHYPRELTLLCD